MRSSSSAIISLMMRSRIAAASCGAKTRGRCVGKVAVAEGE